MAQFSQTSKPSKLNLDKASKYLDSSESFFLLNHEVNSNSSVGVAIPMNANMPACDMELPAGENYAPNNYYSELTNENYTWHFNSNGVDFISRINGEGKCEIVYNGDCLKVSADPKHQITQFRAILDVDFLCNKVPGGKLKRLVWVDGTDMPMASLDVEASIATNFFTTPFFDLCADNCAYLQLCVPEPNGCLNASFIPFTDADKGLSNNITDKGLKFMIRFVYYDGRESEWGDRSTLYFQDIKGCFDSTDGLPRCMKLRIPIGNPMVDKIKLGVSEDGGLTYFLYDTIEKYKKYNTSQQYWYQRELSENVSTSFSESDCSFDYIFCNDKQRLPIDPVQITRVLNPIPREAQGLFRVNNAMAAYNYVVGNCPVDKAEIDKLKVERFCENVVPCETAFAKVTVRAVIIADVVPAESGGANINMGGYIFRKGGSNADVDDPKDTAWFGTGFQILNQKFKGKIRNFIPYIEGTNYWGEMEQWRSSPNMNSFSKIGVLSGLADISTRKWNTNDILSGNFYYQEYIFTVPKGTKGFIRLASHHQETGIGNAQNTSTQVVGTLGANGLKNFNGKKQFPAGTFDETIKEIYFDTCDGDVDNFDAFLVNDVRFDNEPGYSGYISDKNGLPVEGLQIYSNTIYRRVTDFNGFFFFHDNNNSVTINLLGEQDCNPNFVNIGSYTMQSDAATNQMAEGNYKIPTEDYINRFYAKVDVAVKDCNNLPVIGIRVALSNNKYKVTDTSGIAHFKVRNYTTRARQVRAVIMDRGNCFTLDCNNGCNPCMPSSPLTLLMACFIGVPTYPIVIATPLNIKNVTGGMRGLKPGGRYAFAAIVEGDCGKVSASYPLKINNGYFDIPRIQETKSFSFCDFSFDGTGMIFPSWANRLKIVRSTNLTPYTLQWVVDDIARTADGKIILTIQSLNDYNSQFNFKTNTVYQYLKGDKVEFIRNGDGKVFDIATNGILDYLVLSPFNDDVISGVTNNVNYFNQIIIRDDGKLDKLTKGATIEIKPLTVATQQVTYHEFCSSIPIIQVDNGDGTTHGELQVNKGTFDTFDTYLVSRQINRFPPQFFQSKTPSDFWGGNYLDDTGKVHFLNPYENEKRFNRNISINSANQLNYFGDIIKTLDAEEQGGIVAIRVKDNKIGLAICENDNFLFQISDSFLTLGRDGVVHAAPADQVISNPEAKIRGEYGCDYSDIGSIYFGDGFATFASSKNNAYIIHNYSLAQMCGLNTNQQTGQVETSCNSFFQKRMRQKANFNKTATNVLDHYRYSVGQNKTNSVIYLTLKSLRHPATNNAKAVYELPNDTIMYSPITDTFLGFASYTPEGYSELDLHTDDGCSILMYQNSLPFITPIIATKFNTFFGIHCDWAVAISLNKFLEKAKIALALEEQSSTFFFAHKVTTDKVNFLSEIPPVRFKPSNFKWNAAMLNNINSRGGLYNGDNCRGFFIDMVLIRDNTLNLAYKSVDNTKQEAYSELDSILIKYQLIESTGQTENL